MTIPRSTRKIAEPCRFAELAPDAKVRGLGDKHQALVPDGSGGFKRITYDIVVGADVSPPRQGVLALHGPFFMKDVRKLDA